MYLIGSLNSYEIGAHTMKVTVKTIKGLHYLFCRDRMLREKGCFLPHQKAWAETIANNINNGTK
jgi:GR25 family glycosyltransferase involved in LPS biosynthesis